MRRGGGEGEGTNVYMCMLCVRVSSCLMNMCRKM